MTRAELDAVPSYVVNPIPERKINLSTNEVPFGPLPGVAEAVAAATAKVHRYPEMAATGLRDALAARYRVAPERLVTGAGSAALIEHLVRATAAGGGEVVHPWRSFEAYPMLIAGGGGRSVPVPCTPDHRHDLDAILAAVTPATRMILLCHPNNPTGVGLTGAELAAFLDAVPPHLVVAVDEAYREFVTDPALPDALVEHGHRPNVVVLRTFSKAWGLAGIRLGFLVASAEVATAVRKVVTPFSTNALAQAAGLAALRAEPEMLRRVGLVVSERDRLAKALSAWIDGIPAAQANCLWLPVGERAVELARACEERGVLVRPFAGEGVRVTVGTGEENDAFLAAIAEVLA
ncbi:histidinol-phosphate transaminase [Kitasatospora aburaviensis]|uniref:Histidinol-phosphate aminotransferase n=1 Tax=Kitasatospora aburaviensis TaxID=67265 RepID=A0ABW1F2N4_9ACTN